MLTCPSSVRIYICQSAVNLRNSYNGLSGYVTEVIGQDPLSGHLFVFFNKAQDQVKILLWDRSGMCIFSKRLEAGRFHFKRPGTSKEVSMPELLLLLEGIDLHKARRRKRFVLNG